LETKIHHPMTKVVAFKILVAWMPLSKVDVMKEKN